uniref:CAP-Gly domain-containing protein n=1 Tax=Syphacia muris TaxID=451379 RepID=A0A0N5AMS9_9BILA
MSPCWKSSDGKYLGSKDIGKEVFVGTVGKGILRYVGSIKGKQGLFCGVELEKQQGKHDGTYQGTAYFRCPMNHGVFAPVYKVKILTTDQETEQECLDNDRTTTGNIQLQSVNEPQFCLYY